MAGTAPGTVLRRAEDANTLILNNGSSSGGVVEALYKMQTLFQGIVTAMDPINQLVDPKYGLMAGLNCKILG